jgi:hypothetical protein
VVVGVRDLSPDAKSVAFFARFGGEMWIATSSLERFEPKLLYRFANNELPDWPSWSNDGWISFGMKRGDEAPALWGVRSSGGPITRRASLPAACNGRWTRVAAAAPVGVCIAEDPRPDIWVIELSRLR